jgi:hypothetical protein
MPRVKRSRFPLPVCIGGVRGQGLDDGEVLPPAAVQGLHEHLLTLGHAPVVGNESGDVALVFQYRSEVKVTTHPPSGKIPRWLP